MNFIYAENFNIWGTGGLFLQEEFLPEKGRRVLMVRYMVPGGGGAGRAVIGLPSGESLCTRTASNIFVSK
jgi:hypothetical protein